MSLDYWMWNKREINLGLDQQCIKLEEWTDILLSNPCRPSRYHIRTIIWFPTFETHPLYILSSFSDFSSPLRMIPQSQFEGKAKRGLPENVQHVDPLKNLAITWPPPQYLSLPSSCRLGHQPPHPFTRNNCLSLNWPTTRRCSSSAKAGLLNMYPTI